MPNTLQLYSLATPNGQKASIALEAMNLDYKAHTIDITKGEQFSREFIKINPNSKIPALVDPNGPGGKTINIMESGAILIYLAEKSGLFLSKDPYERNQTLQWLFFQVGSVGPMFGQFGHFYKYGKDQCSHPYPLERYTNETKRLLDVINHQLSARPFLSGDQISIADFATAPWVICLDKFYDADEYLSLQKYGNINDWLSRFSKLEYVKRGMEVCSLT